MAENDDIDIYGDDIDYETPLLDQVSAIPGRFSAMSKR